MARIVPHSLRRRRPRPRRLRQERARGRIRVAPRPVHTAVTETAQPKVDEAGEKASREETPLAGKAGEVATGGDVSKAPGPAPAADPAPVVVLDDEVDDAPEEYDFEDIEVSGDLVQPQGELLTKDFLQNVPAGRSYQDSVGGLAAGARATRSRDAAPRDRRRQIVKKEKAKRPMPSKPAVVMAPPPVSQPVVTTPMVPPADPNVVVPESKTEDYTDYGINGFDLTERDNLSTFAVDVDTASYTITRRKLNEGYLPPTSAVRVEEFVNYFPYEYAQPKAGDPLRRGHGGLALAVQPDEPHRAGRRARKEGGIRQPQARAPDLPGGRVWLHAVPRQESAC